MHGRPDRRDLRLARRGRPPARRHVHLAAQRGLGGQRRIEGGKRQPGKRNLPGRRIDGKRDQVVAKIATTATDGKTYQVEHYSLDVIILVGYRMKSQRHMELVAEVRPEEKESMISLVMNFLT
ncbi:MAG TPA: virulence RhuM family protein [Candidatus Aphodovivens excrementavium]|nr:virulence RhuM family protein [Candidatus Aphodovivens excrementavium]